MIDKILIDKPTERAAFGRQIKHHREIAGLSIAELCRRTGLHSANICRIEQGKYTPTFDTLLRIARACNSFLIIE